ncbi:MAG TPA: DUF4352 domain-containing protein [Anaerolineales bacterium]|jgi:hypothetical protein|nr:DUF4352 domain-containing protein [Anaerolineales bacterium]
MRRNSLAGLVLTLLMVAALAVLSVVLVQGAWLNMVQGMLTASPTYELPVSTTPFPTYTFPKVLDPVSPGVEAVVNNSIGITVTRVISPADSYVGKAGFPSVPLEGKEYLVVDIKVRCVSAKEKCRLTEFDFGVETKDGQTYPAELSGNFSDELPGIFEGGDIQPGKSLSGSLIFIIPKGTHGLTLIYPRLYGFADTARFTLGK